MYVYLKYILFIVGLYGAVIGIINLEIAPSIVSVGSFIAFAMIEVRDLKTINDEKD